MKTRLTQPSNNKYYIRQVTGGLNGAVAGSPTIKGANVLCNCVGYANGRFNEIIGDPDLKGVVLKFQYQLVCNAENFIESAKKQGLKINSTPIQGGIMVWQKGATLGGRDGAGHVAVVEAVYDDGSILTSESGWASWAFKTVRRNNSNGRWGQASGYKFRGCIINPSVKDPKVVPVPPLTVDGIGGACTIRALQKYLGTPQDGEISNQNKMLIKKYVPSLSAVTYGKNGSACVKALQKWLGIKQDGVWGQATSKALQKKLGVSVDGIFGTNSMKALQTFLNDNKDKKAVYPTTTTTTPAVKSTQDKMLDYADKLISKGFKYVNYGKQKACPICGGGKIFGSNCIGFVDQVMKHGGGIPVSCTASGIISDEFGNKLYKSSNKLATWESRNNNKGCWKIIWNGGNKIPTSMLQKGDIGFCYNGSKYKHSFLYRGNGKISDCSSGKGKAVTRNYSSLGNPCKIAVRWIGK